MSCSGNESVPEAVAAAMKPFSLGVDIEEVARFKKLLRNHRFLQRVFTAEEIHYCRSKKNSAQHFAVRFAAKEAVWKALSPAIFKTKSSVGHRDIGVRNDKSGKPAVVLPASLARYRGRVTLSLSHTDAYAVAVALVAG
jgi:holo-[acyl-carrier protein] synthase